MVNGINNNPFKLIDYSIKDTKNTDIAPEANEEEAQVPQEDVKTNSTQNQTEIGKYEAIASKQNLVKVDFEKVLKEEKNKLKETKEALEIFSETIEKEIQNETSSQPKKSIWDKYLHKVVSHAPVKPVANTGGDTGSTYVPEESVSVDEGDFAVSEEAVSGISVSDSSSASAGDAYSSSAEVAVYVED